MNRRLFAFAIASLFIAGSLNAVVGAKHAAAQVSSQAAADIAQAITALQNSDTTGAGNALASAELYAPPSAQQKLYKVRESLYGLTPEKLHRQLPAITTRLQDISREITKSK